MYTPQNRQAPRRGSYQTPTYSGEYVAMYRGKVVAHDKGPIDVDRVPEGSTIFFSINGDAVRQLTRR
ncbi:MAG TPA: hypothetical protein VFF28_07810 [Candidatus Nanoarchaeia archaeon]|nr:hypothetical protein [Candidatus Nanoarchaeia archaeon]